MVQLEFEVPSTAGEPARRIVMRKPDAVVQANTLAGVRNALTRVEEATRRGLHAGGWITYEAAPAFDAAMQVRPGASMPRVWFGLFPPDHVSEGPAPAAVSHEPTPTPDWHLEIEPEQYASAIARVREAIAAGRTYQVNLTARLSAPLEGEPRALFDRMRAAQGAAYHAFLDTGRYVVLSASPELFFHTRGRQIVTRPMKGTRPRGRWPEEDRRLRVELAAAAKDRAENLMIVDLLRNDLGRISETGSVRVADLHRIERYPTVWQMTSTIEGSLREDIDLLAILDALFPCGSVTGAPKISTMAEIAELEASPRDVYCGAIGWLRPDGERLFSVPIRTAWVDRQVGTLRYGAGGGIVWDSTADAELDELRAKAVVVREPWPPFQLIETLRLEDGGYTRRDRHLGRLSASADYFGFPDPHTAAGRALDRLARRHPTGRCLARLTFHRDGTADAEARPLETVGSPTPPYDDDAYYESVRAPAVLAHHPVDSTDRFLFHKTTHRAVYDRARSALAAGDFDVLLHNERGELTEFTRGNLVLELDGRWLTPPTEAGLLDGCLRQELLEAGLIEEAILRTEDLDRAARVWFMNSARGWVPVRIRRGEG